MVTLSRIYTKTGDQGKTRLGDMSEVEKTDPRIEAYGCVDELNAVLGLAVAAEGPTEHRNWMLGVQNDLFDLGADLCRPEDEPSAAEAGSALRITADQVSRLETEIDRLNAPLKPLKSFVLPGGTPLAAWLHMARTVCRRAERRVWALAAVEKVNPHALQYLNRLSDLLFVLSRSVNQESNADILWKPGLNQT